MVGSKPFSKFTPHLSRGLTHNTTLQVHFSNPCLSKRWPPCCLLLISNSSREYGGFVLHPEVLQPKLTSPPFTLGAGSGGRSADHPIRPPLPLPRWPLAPPPPSSRSRSCRGSSSGYSGPPSPSVGRCRRCASAAASTSRRPTSRAAPCRAPSFPDQYNSWGFQRSSQGGGGPQWSTRARSCYLGLGILWSRG